MVHRPAPCWVLWFKVTSEDLFPTSKKKRTATHPTTHVALKNKQDMKKGTIRCSSQVRLARLMHIIGGFVRGVTQRVLVIIIVVVPQVGHSLVVQLEMVLVPP